MSTTPGSTAALICSVESEGPLVVELPELPVPPEPEVPDEPALDEPPELAGGGMVMAVEAWPLVFSFELRLLWTRTTAAINSEATTSPPRKASWLLRRVFDLGAGAGVCGAWPNEPP
jgi:hypothetical protein